MNPTPARRAFTAAAFAVLLWATGTPQFAAAEIAPPSITVTDDLNRTVTLPAHARRIISLAPHNTENLFSAGAGDKIVGVGAHSDYPPEARQIPSVGDHAQVNLEAVIALAPDLVVAWETGHNREALKKIARLGFPVYYSEPRAFEDIIENIEELALLAGAADIHSTPARLREELAQVRAEYADRPLMTVFYQVWREPLMTVNGAHFISRALELCGARNVFADLPIIAPRISVESVLKANPDIIITGRVNGDLSTPDLSMPDLAMWRKWRSLSAVKNDGFVFVESDIMHRHTARMILGIRGLCEEIERVRGKVKP